MLGASQSRAKAMPTNKWLKNSNAALRSEKPIHGFLGCTG